MGRDEGWGGDTVRERGLDISARYLGIRVIAEGEGRGREIREFMGRRRWKAGKRKRLRTGIASLQLYS